MAVRSPEQDDAFLHTKATPSTAMNSTSLEVQTSYGPVTGFADTFPLRSKSSADEIEKGANGGEAPVLKWLGIPYAQAGRWQRPCPPQPWTQPLSATDYGPMFPQPPSGTEILFGQQPGVLHRDIGVSENAFTVNVYAPEGTRAGDNLPVMNFIYGGSLNNGSADRFLYDPTEMIRAAGKHQKFMVITGNYRTNIFDSEGLVGNYGLYDCVAILEWIKTNIKAFGGNQDNVTLFGQSAGSFLASKLLVSKRKLFHRAILMSGGPSTMQIKDHKHSYPAHAEILNRYGPGGATPHARVAALRALSFSELLKAHDETYKFGGLSLTLEEGPNATWKTDTLKVIQGGGLDPWIKGVIIGTTEDEGTMFTAGMKLASPAAFSAYLQRFPQSICELIKVKYLKPFGGTHPESPSLIEAPASRLIADQLFVDPAWDVAVALSQSVNDCKVWLYRCRAEVDTLTKGTYKLGSMHLVDVPLVFNSKTLWKETDHEAPTAAAFCLFFSTFAINGYPSDKWTMFNRSSPSWRVFYDGGKIDEESLEGYEKQRIDWSGERHSEVLMHP